MRLFFEYLAGNWGFGQGRLVPIKKALKCPCYTPVFPLLVNCFSRSSIRMYITKGAVHQKSIIVKSGVRGMEL